MNLPNPDKKWQLASTAVYASAFTVLGLTFAVLGPTLSALAAQTGVALQGISFLFVARALGSLAGSIGGGRLIDHLPGHVLVAAALVFLALASFLTPVIGQLWLLTLVIFISGVVHGTLNVSGNALLIWVHGRGVAPYMNALHFFFGLGTFLAPLIVARIVLWAGGPQWAYWMMAALTIPVAVFPLFVRSPRPEKRSDLPAGGKADPWLAFFLTFIFFGYAGASGAFGSWIFTYITRLGLADEPSAAYLNSLFWGALMVGRLLSIPLAMRFSPKNLLSLDLFGALASLAVVAVFPTSIVAIGVAAAGLGFFLATIFPTTMSLASRHMVITGKLTGIFSVGSSLGTLVTPWLVGQFFESWGPGVLISFNLVTLAATLVAFFLMLPRLKQAA